MTGIPGTWPPGLLWPCGWPSCVGTVPCSPKRVGHVPSGLPVPCSRVTTGPGWPGARRPGHQRGFPGRCSGGIPRGVLWTGIGRGGPDRGSGGQRATDATARHFPPEGAPSVRARARRVHSSGSRHGSSPGGRLRAARAGWLPPSGPRRPVGAGRSGRRRRRSGAMRPCEAGHLWRATTNGPAMPEPAR